MPGFLALIVGCSLHPPGPTETEAVSQGPKYLSLDDLIQTYSVSRGEGRIRIRGDKTATLNFQYTLSRDTLFILFKDYLGRRSVFLRVVPDGLTGWNLAEGRSIPMRQIARENPAINLLTPADLIRLFWGVAPDLDYLNSRQSRDKDSVQFSFTRMESTVGRLIQSAVISTDKFEVELNFQPRVLGQLETTLGRKIPKTIPWDL
ncbi:MAG: hypothetical protein ACE5D1_01235 [Fidelibacterota bacterium]